MLSLSKHLADGALSILGNTPLRPDTENPSSILLL